MNCLYTVNIGEFVTDYTRKSFRAACYRWGCDYHEILHQVPNKAPSCSKLLGPSRLSAYEKVIYLDGDTVISPNAPNPFDLCTNPTFFYAVCDYLQPTNHNDAWLEYIYRMRIEVLIKEQPQLTPPEPERFFNAGMFMVFTTPAVQDMMNVALNIMPTDGEKFVEQARFNVVVNSTHGIALRLLPDLWNHILPNNEMPDPDVYVNHFGGWAHTLLNKLSANAVT